MFNALMNYGFEARGCGLFWGIGSLMWGWTVAIKKVAFGVDLYEVTVSHWQYNEWGECVVDETTTTVAHGGQVWNLLPERVLKGWR